MSHGHRGRGRPKNIWKKDLEKEMWTAEYKYTALEEDGGGSTE